MGTQNEVLKKMVKVGLIEKAKFKWRPGRGEGVCQTGACGESFSGRGCSWSKGYICPLGWTLAGQVGEQSGGQAIGPKIIQVRDEVMEVLICRAL